METKIRYKTGQEDKCKRISIQVISDLDFLKKSGASFTSGDADKLIRIYQKCMFNWCKQYEPFSAIREDIFKIYPDIFPVKGKKKNEQGDLFEWK